MARPNLDSTVSPSLMRPQTRRLFIAIGAWPAGILAAIVAAVVFSLATAEPCPPGPECVQGLEQASWAWNALWLAMAVLPGTLATRAWWNGRKRGDP